MKSMFSILISKRHICQYSTKEFHNIMREFNFLHKLVQFVEISIMETFVRIKVGSSQTNPISVKLGLRQGDSILPVLFNIVLEKVIRSY